MRRAFGVEAVLADDFPGKVGEFFVHGVPLFLSELGRVFESLGNFLDPVLGVPVIDAVELWENVAELGEVVADGGDVGI